MKFYIYLLSFNCYTSASLLWNSYLGQILSSSPPPSISHISGDKNKILISITATKELQKQITRRRHCYDSDFNIDQIYFPHTSLFLVVYFQQPHSYVAGLCMATDQWTHRHFSISPQQHSAFKIGRRSESQILFLRGDIFKSSSLTLPRGAMLLLFIATSHLPRNGPTWSAPPTLSHWV